MDLLEFYSVCNFENYFKSSFYIWIKKYFKKIKLNLCIKIIIF